MSYDYSNRRTFLKLSLMGAALSASSGCASLRRSKGTASQTDRDPSAQPLRLAFIGVGGIGRNHLNFFTQAGVQIAALCDVDEHELQSAREMIALKFPGVRCFQDFRVMFESVENLDGAVIATPDHGHGMQAVWALRAGCHLYLETPVVHTLDELTLLAQEARRAGRMVACGELNTAHETALRACEALRTGVTGPIAQVHLWTSRPVWQQGMELPSGSDPVPATLAWDLWLAGAAPRPYKRFAYHKFNWRGWTAFGSGALGDIGPQLLSFPFKALGLSAPERVERLHADGGSAVSYPRSSAVRLLCHSAFQKNRVELFWYDGGRLPPSELLQQTRATLGRVPGTGVLLTGERGSWLLSGSDCTQHFLGLNGSPRMTDFEKHDLWSTAPQILPRTGSAPERFLQALRSGTKVDFKISAEAALHTAVLTGAIAQRLGEPLEWNDRKGRFNKNEPANQLLRPDLQPGWEFF